VLGWWSDVCNLKNVSPSLGRDSIVIRVLSPLLFLRSDCECNRPFLFATVFLYASAFNGDLNQWNVATVTDMSGSKSLSILEKGLTGRKFML
jgi:surface protein